MPYIADDNGLDFSDLPPFPTDIPTVPLLRISLSKLLANDAAELDRLWQASTELGFFYLDLTPAPESTPAIDTASLLSEVDQLFTLGRDVFALPVSEKIKYDLRPQGQNYGYKGYGDGIVDSKGTRDRNEFYMISKDDILGVSPPLAAPALLTPARPLIASYMQSCHAIVTLLLDRLNTRLALPPGTLAALHRLSAPSGDQLRWVHAPASPTPIANPALGEHTDFGSVTVLFNRMGGLQVLPPESKEWAYVRPLRNHAVVNLGDAMVKFTAGVLRSNIHRVVDPPGEQRGKARMSLVYFSRPEDEVLLKRLEGSAVIDEAGKDQADDEKVWTAKEWTLRRALGRRSGGKFEESGGTEGNRS